MHNRLYIEKKPSKLNITKKDVFKGKPYQHWSALQWQLALLEYYFTDKDNKGNFPVTFLSVTKQTLAHLAEESLDEVDCVFNAYRHHLPKTSHDLEIIFERYWNWESDANVPSKANLATFKNNPQHLMLLVFSCLVACTDLAPNGNTSQYPQRLQNLLGYRETPQSIRGLASMWRTFAAYLKQRQIQIPSTRLLELPHIGSETRIGHAKRLAFPEYYDRRRLRRFLHGIDQTVLTPDYLAKIFSNSASVQFNVSFQTAYQDFLSQVRKGASQTQLKQTKFFEAISAFVEQETFTNDLRKYTHIRIEILFDFQGSPNIEVLPDGNCHGFPFNDQGAINKDCLFNQSQHYNDNLAPELSSAIKMGVLLFKQVVGVLWQWSPEPAEQQPLLALINSQTSPIPIPIKGKRWRMFGTWTLIKLDSHQATTIIQSLSTQKVQVNEAIRLLGAARVGLGYLINRISAPRVGAPNATTVQSRGQDGNWVTLNSQNDGSWGPISAGDEKVLIRAKNAQGGYRHRRFQAHSQALCHQQLAVPNPKFFFEPERVSLPLDAVDFPQSQAMPLCNQLKDLLETLYADGQHGLSEVEVIDWIRRAYPDSVVSPWLVLQGLIDSCWLQEAYYLAWHSRKFFLRPITCILQPIDYSRCRLHFEGALPSVAQERIRVAVEALGCELCQGASLSPFVPAPLFVETTEEHAETIAHSLGCHLDSLHLRLIDEKPLELKKSMGIYRTWCWRAGRFMEPEHAKTVVLNNVRLDQLRYHAQSGLDRFQISYGMHFSQYYLPKVAIRQAYKAAGKPLFELANHKLVNLAGYPALSSELARVWRLQTLTSPGPIYEADNVVRYSYPCPSLDLVTQDKRIATLISGDKPFMPFWMKARTLQAIGQGSPTQFCQPHGLITPDINFLVRMYQ